MHTIVMNIPNLLSSFRLIAAPILLFIASQSRPNLFLALLAVSLMTDAIDGFIARRYKVTSETGARLDSWGDFVTFITIGISAWWLWPGILHREMFFVATGIMSFLLPVAAGLIKFRRLPSYHTWAAKIQALLMSSTIFIIFGLGITWPFRYAVLLQVLVSIEEIIITLFLKEQMCNVPSLWHLRQSLPRDSAITGEMWLRKWPPKLIGPKT
jgi:CDP-diacylglycerol--glycerol-3-phosphate 3-phosphatidyltransferase